MLLEVHIHKMLVNGEQWGSWQGYHLPISNEHVTVWTPIGTFMQWKLWSWITEKHSLTYFWPKVWYIIQVNYFKDGSFSDGYCDIVLPTQLYASTSHELFYTDLYLDVVIREDRSVYTKDQEIFDHAALQYPIVEESRQTAFEVLAWLEEHAKNWSGPFQSIPQHLPRTDWDKLSKEEIRDAMSIYP